MEQTGCIESEMGILLHAYELGLLSDPEREQFEVHLLVCEHCVSSLKKFESQIALMRSDSRVKNELQQLDDSSKSKSTDVSTLSSLFRTIRSSNLRFGAYLVLMIAVLYPLYRIYSPDSSRSNTLVQSIFLVPSRSAFNEFSGMVLESDVSIEFAFDGSIQGNCYIVTLYDARDSTIYRDDSYCEFDSLSVGSITVNSKTLLDGRYRLTVFDQADSALTGTQEYRFRVNYEK